MFIYFFINPDLEGFQLLLGSNEDPDLFQRVDSCDSVLGLDGALLTGSEIPPIWEKEISQIMEDVDGAKRLIEISNIQYQGTFDQAMEIAKRFRYETVIWNGIVCQEAYYPIFANNAKMEAIDYQWIDNLLTD